MKEILVLGIGNLILNDEGVGIHVVKEMMDKNLLNNYVDYLDGGTGGYLLVSVMSLYKHVIIIDATLDKDNNPGKVNVAKPLYPSDFPPILSAHEFGLRQMIESLYFIEQVPNLHLITVSVKNYQRVGMKLSLNVKDAVPKAISAVETVVGSIIREEIENEPKLLRASRKKRAKVYYDNI